MSSEQPSANPTLDQPLNRSPVLPSIQQLLSSIVMTLKNGVHEQKVPFMNLLTVIACHAPNLAEHLASDDFVYAVTDSLASDSDLQRDSAVCLLDTLVICSQRNPSSFTDLFQALVEDGVCDLLADIEDTDHIIESLTTDEEKM